MVEYTVTYHIQEYQDAEIENLVILAKKAGWNITKESLFSIMMTAGADYLISEKIAYQKGVLSANVESNS